MKNKKLEGDTPHNNYTNFGFTRIPTEEKAARVKGVFDSVASSYDLMNDAMSLGVHRLWKRYCVFLADIQPHNQILDLAAGSADLSIHIASALTTGCVTVTDSNETMLQSARAKMIDAGLVERARFEIADGCSLQYPDNSFDMLFCAFGLRNMTHQQQALCEMLRVLKPGGSAWILEFSKVRNPILTKLYDFYSYKLIPKIGAYIAKDADSYQYLVESIRTHPNQEALQKMMQDACFKDVRYSNLSAGIVAIHRGWKR